MKRKNLTGLIAALAVVSILVPTGSESGIFKDAKAAADATNVSEVIGDSSAKNSVTKEDIMNDIFNSNCKVTITFKEGVALENVKITVDSNYNIVVQGLNAGDYTLSEFISANGYKPGQPKLVSLNLSNLKNADVSKIYGALTYNTVQSDGTIKTFSAGSVYNPTTGVLSSKVDKPTQYSALIQKSATILTSPIVIQPDAEVVNGQLKIVTTVNTSTAQAASTSTKKKSSSSSTSTPTTTEVDRKSVV